MIGLRGRKTSRGRRAPQIPRGRPPPAAMRGPAGIKAAARLGGSGWPIVLPGLAVKLWCSRARQRGRLSSAARGECAEGAFNRQPPKLSRGCQGQAKPSRVHGVVDRPLHENPLPEDRVRHRRARVCAGRAAATTSPGHAAAQVLTSARVAALGSDNQPSEEGPRLHHPKAFAAPTNVFICYADEDRDLLAELVKHLALLRRDGIIRDYHAALVAPGEDWRRAVKEQIDGAALILLLVSASFLASDDCYLIETDRAIGRQELGLARVVPVILRPCDWETAVFGKLQALPQDGKPVVCWPDRDEAWLAIVRGLRIALGTVGGLDDGLKGPRRPVERDPRTVLVRVGLVSIVLLAAGMGINFSRREPAINNPCQGGALHGVVAFGDTATCVTAAFGKFLTCLESNDQGATIADALQRLDAKRGTGSELEDAEAWVVGTLRRGQETGQIDIVEMCGLRSGYVAELVPITTASAPPSPPASRASQPTRGPVAPCHVDGSHGNRPFAPNSCRDTSSPRPVSRTTAPALYALRPDCQEIIVHECL